MAKDRYKFFESIYNPSLDSEQKYRINLKEFTDKFKEGSLVNYQIPLKFSYRPDLISNYLYGSWKYHWVLTYINYNENSLEDFAPNKIIKIPKLSDLISLL